MVTNVMSCMFTETSVVVVVYVQTGRSRSTVLGTVDRGPQEEECVSANKSHPVTSHLL